TPSAVLLKEEDKDEDKNEDKKQDVPLGSRGDNEEKAKPKVLKRWQQPTSGDNEEKAKPKGAKKWWQAASNRVAQVMGTKKTSSCLTWQVGNEEYTYNPLHFYLYGQPSIRQRIAELWTLSPSL